MVPSPNRISLPIAECADPGACHVSLGGINPERVVCYFAEVPILTLEVNRRIDFVQGLFDCEKIVLKTKAHQVEPKPVDAVFLRPDFEGIEHELEEHAMF